MSRDERRTRCKHCGKVIVGRGKMGLCDRCFNNRATGVVSTAGGAYVGWKFILKPFINWLNSRKNK